MNEQSLSELIQEVDDAIKHERHRNYQETMYWCRQWRLLATSLAGQVLVMWRKAGSTKSEAKANAARRNGKKGGRPRKA